MFDNYAHQVFLEKAYREVFGLLVEVRDYVAGPSKEDGEALLPQDRAMLVHELTKITRRLTDAMAWLLLQKAVAAEEITTEEALRRAAGTLSLEAVAEDGADGGAPRRLPVKLSRPSLGGSFFSPCRENNVNPH